MLFKATYAEAADSISRILFISDRVSNSRPEQPHLLSGFFLLAETKAVQKKDQTAHHLKKLHLVEIQQTEVKLKKAIELRDKLEQIDTLTFGEETEKFVDFARMADEKTFFVFLLNRETIGKCP